MSNATLREALEAVRRTLHEANELDDSPICDTIWMPGAGSETLFDYIDAALAADDAARGTMREQFERVFEMERALGDIADLVFESSEEFASTNDPQIVVSALKDYMAGVKLSIESASRAAAPQAEQKALYWPEFPPFPTWINANDLHSLHEWAQTVRRDAFAAGMQRAAAPQSVEPDEWIACSERLPEDKAPILMVGVEFGPRADYTTDQYAGWLSQGTWVRWPHRPPPTHWRPLPAPPTKKEQP